MKKVAIVGVNGQLGSDLRKVYESDGYSVLGLKHADLEISNAKNVQEKLGSINFDVLINTAAYHRVDEIESNKQKAFLVNGIGAMNLAGICQRKKARFVYMSTDYVFGGDSKRITPYTEDDLVFPVNTYGITKIVGESLASLYCKQALIIRTSGLFGVAGSSGKGGNFVETMLRLAREGEKIRVVNDQILSPTYTLNLAAQVKKLIDGQYSGVFHAVSEGNCSWYDFASEIFRLIKLKPKLEKATSKQKKTDARRPSYSALENSRLKDLKINNMNTWQNNLKLYLKEKGHLKDN